MNMRIADRRFKECGRYCCFSASRSCRLPEVQTKLKKNVGDLSAQIDQRTEDCSCGKEGQRSDKEQDSGPAVKEIAQEGVGGGSERIAERVKKEKK